MGDFGKRLFEVQIYLDEFPIAAQQACATQEISGRGSPSFWVPLLGEARKSTSPRGENKHYKIQNWIASLVMTTIKINFTNKSPPEKP